MPEPSWTDRLSVAVLRDVPGGPSNRGVDADPRWPARQGQARGRAVRGGSVFHNATSGRLDRSGRSSTVPAALLASRARTLYPLLSAATGMAPRTPRASASAPLWLSGSGVARPTVASASGAEGRLVQLGLPPALVLGRAPACR